VILTKMTEQEVKRYGKRTYRFKNSIIPEN
jgi:hypothetical protein